MSFGRLEGWKRHTHKEHRENPTESDEIQDFSRYFQEVSGYFQGIFRVFFSMPFPDMPVEPFLSKCTLTPVFWGSRNTKNRALFCHCRERLFGGNCGTGEHLPKPPWLGNHPLLETPDPRRAATQLLCMSCVDPGVIQQYSWKCWKCVRFSKGGVTVWLRGGGSRVGARNWYHLSKWRFDLETAHSLASKGLVSRLLTIIMFDRC